MKTKNIFLSKSDFKVAQNCRTKLYYKKHKYPNEKQGSEYLAMLADQGYMVGLMAQLLYEDGTEINNDNTESAIKESEKLLFSDEKSITLFEPAIYSNNKLVRIDILKKENKEFHIIEVKSKSYNPDKHREHEQKGKSYFESSGWLEYLEDLAFQTYTLTDKLSGYSDFENYKVRSFFLIPDKSSENKIEGLIGQFIVDAKENTKKDPNKFSKKDIKFTGDLKELRNNDFFTLKDVTDEVQNIIENVKANAELYIEDLISNKKYITPLSCKCKGCEYSITDNNHAKSGFDECWGDKSKTQPHILELYQLGNFNRKKISLSNDKKVKSSKAEKEQAEKIGIIDDLIRKGFSKITDIPEDYLINKYNNRAYYQLKEQKETLSSEFKNIFNEVKYPLWFVDFENTNCVIPFHKGMHPFEPVLFQWSCHKISTPESEPEHYEWINVESYYPNFEFALSLKNCIGTEGTVLTWSHHESTMLGTILEKMHYTGKKDPDLESWLDNIDSRILDLNRTATQYYFHPDTKGKTSLKVTLPAILKGIKSKRVEKWLKEHNIEKGLSLFKRDDKGIIVNPYELLPPFDIPGIEVFIKEGGEAMIAYKDMMYGIHKDNIEIKNKYRDSLLEYCKLDTLAMVIVWERWKEIIIL